MSWLLIVSCLAAMASLWVVACKIDRDTRLTHIVATVLMMAGVVSVLGFALMAKVVSGAWFINGLCSLMLGVAIWVGFDRRHAHHVAEPIDWAVFQDEEPVVFDFEDHPFQPSQKTCAEKQAEWHEKLTERD